MSARTLQGWERRIGLFLVLVIGYLLLLHAMHAIHQARAHGRLEREIAERAKLAARAVTEEADPARLAAALRAWRERGTLPDALPLSRRHLLDRGLLKVELLTPDGWGLGTSIATAQGAVAKGRQLDAEVRRELALGRAVADPRPRFEGPDGAAVVIAHSPVMDAAGRLAAIVAVHLRADDLARSERELRWGLGIQTASVVVFLALVVCFTSWLLRPVRLLARTAGASDEEITSEIEAQDDTGFVIETYKNIIDELKEKELELRRLRELERHRADEFQDLNASIIDSLVSGVLVLDLSGRVRSMNDVAREILGVGEGRAIGRPFADVLGHVSELHARLQACLDDGLVIRRDELRLNLPGIGRRDLGLTLSPLMSRDGARTGALCLVVDLTVVKRLQEQVRMKASLAELGEIAAGIAHEFRNSLATMLGYAKLIERSSGGEIAEHSRDILDEITALRTVVDDFLRFANPTRLVLETIDLAEMVGQLARDIEGRCAGKKIRLEIGPGLPAVTGDETLLGRVFLNLVRNAADAAADGGLIRVSAEPGDGEVSIHVDDDGPGLGDADPEKLFIPFYTTKERGTGLGLALVRKVVVHHGGRVLAGRSPLGGARFTVTLPLRPERETEGGAASPRVDDR